MPACWRGCKGRPPADAGYRICYPFRLVALRKHPLAPMTVAEFIDGESDEGHRWQFIDGEPMAKETRAAVWAYTTLPSVREGCAIPDDPARPITAVQLV